VFVGKSVENRYEIVSNRRRAHLERTAAVAVVDSFPPVHFRLIKEGEWLQGGDNCAWNVNGKIKKASGFPPAFQYLSLD
jgi:hypothetical protein